MSDATLLLTKVQQGDPKAADELLELVYQELRQLAAHKMAQESPGQTLQPTALVHEAWLRLSRHQVFLNRKKLMHPLSAIAFYSRVPDELLIFHPKKLAPSCRGNGNRRSATNFSHGVGYGFPVNWINEAGG